MDQPTFDNRLTATKVLIARLDEFAGGETDADDLRAAMEHWIALESAATKGSIRNRLKRAFKALQTATEPI